MCKVLKLNGKTGILSLLGVILLFLSHYPAFSFSLDHYLTEFIPRLLHESAIALILRSSKQFLDN